MSDWLVNNRYGHGAGRVPILGEVHMHPTTPDGVMIGMRRMVAEANSEPGSLARRLVIGPFFLFGLFIMSSLMIQMLFQPPDESSVEIVMLESIPLFEPLPPEEIIQPEPIQPALPVPVPMEQVEKPKPVAKPKPPPQQVKPEPRRRVEIAKAPPPKPKPVKIEPISKPVMKKQPEQQIARKERARPVPANVRRPPPSIQMDKVAKAEPTKTKTRAPERVQRVAENKPRKKVDLQPVASIPKEPQKSEPNRRPERVAIKPDTKRRTQTNVALPTVASTPELPNEAPAQPRERFTLAQAPKKQARRVQASPIPMNEPELPQEQVAQVTRGEGVSAPSRNKPRRDASAPKFASSKLEASDELDSPATARRSSVSDSVKTARRSSSVDQNALSLPSARSGANSSLPASIDSKSSIRSAQVVADPSSRGGNVDPSLEAVSLGSLAACMSDKEEDSLKQQLVAAVTTQQECVSAAGTYRFVETKNLNAFLMWIERAPSRAEVDRCVELKLALDCLAH